MDKIIIPKYIRLKGEELDGVGQNEFIVIISTAVVGYLLDNLLGGDGMIGGLIALAIGFLISIPLPGKGTKLYLLVYDIFKFFNSNKMFNNIKE